jgi:hypothetical protein
MILLIPGLFVYFLLKVFIGSWAIGIVMLIVLLLASELKAA